MISLIKKDFLSTLPLFSKLTSEELNHILSNSKQRRYPKANIIYYQGDVSSELYFVLKGRVKSVLMNENGREVILEVLESGDCFGQTCLISGWKRLATAVSLEACEILALPGEMMLNKLRKYPPDIDMLSKELYQKFTMLIDVINDIAFLEVKNRVAKTILSMCPNDFIDNTKADYTIFEKPNVKDIAAMAFTSRETASRVLSDFRKESYVEFQSKKIIVHKRLKLLNTDGP